MVLSFIGIANLISKSVCGFVIRKHEPAWAVPGTFNILLIIDKATTEMNANERKYITWAFSKGHNIPQENLKLLTNITDVYVP